MYMKACKEYFYIVSFSSGAHADSLVGMLCMLFCEQQESPCPTLKGDIRYTVLCCMYFKGRDQGAFILQKYLGTWTILIITLAVHQGNSITNNWGISLVYVALE